MSEFDLDWPVSKVAVAIAVAIVCVITLTPMLAIAYAMQAKVVPMELHYECDKKTNSCTVRMDELESLLQSNMNAVEAAKKCAWRNGKA